MDRNLTSDVDRETAPGLVTHLSTFSGRNELSLLNSSNVAVIRSSSSIHLGLKKRNGLVEDDPPTSICGDAAARYWAMIEQSRQHVQQMATSTLRTHSLVEASRQAMLDSMSEAVRFKDWSKGCYGPFGV